MFITKNWSGGSKIIRKGRRFPKRFLDKILSASKPVHAHWVAQMLYIISWLETWTPCLAKLRLSFKDYASLKGKTLKYLKITETVD